jgi:hypothetical protein
MNQSQYYEDQSSGEIQRINHNGDMIFSRGSRACRHVTSPLCQPTLGGSAAKRCSMNLVQPVDTARTYPQVR